MIHYSESTHGLMAHVSNSPGVETSPPGMKSPPPTIIIPTAVGTMEAVVAVTLDFTGRVYHDGVGGVKSYTYSHLEMGGGLST